MLPAETVFCVLQEYEHRAPGKLPFPSVSTLVAVTGYCTHLASWRQGLSGERMAPELRHAAVAW